MNGHRAKGPSPADLQLWAAYAQSLTRLLPGKTRLAVETVAAEPAPQPAGSAGVLVKPAAKPGFISTAQTPTGLDKSTWRKFSTGKIRAAAKLDLHGFTAARAHHAVNRFLETAYAEQARCVEIITGNGDILARELPLWLNAPALRALVLAIAHPHAANTGALRILLRRRRG